MIEWESKDSLSWKDSKVYIGDKQVRQYRFQSNYYFVAGDKTETLEIPVISDLYRRNYRRVAWKCGNPLTLTRGNTERDVFGKIFETIEEL